MASKWLFWPAAASAATLPSCTALCASIGWPTMSPMAKMCGMLVRICLSTGMKPRSSTATPAFSAPIALAVRPPADRDQDPVEGLGRGRLRPFEMRRQPVRPRLDLRHLGLEVDRLVTLLDPLHQRRDDVLVGAGDDLVHQLDDRHLGAERVVDGRHLQPDDAAADHQQALRHAVELQRAGAVDHARVVMRDEGQRHRLGAGGDDRLLEGDGVRRAVAAVRPRPGSAR